MVENLIFYPLAEYNPVSLKLEPLLIKKIPELEHIEEGEYTGMFQFEYEIMEEASWEDGSPVTAYDYLFTLKTAFNPRVNASSWRGFFSLIRDVLVDPSNPKKFSVVLEEDHILALELTCNFAIYPQYYSICHSGPDPESSFCASGCRIKSGMTFGTNTLRRLKIAQYFSISNIFIQNSSIPPFRLMQGIQIYNRKLQ